MKSYQKAPPIEAIPASINNIEMALSLRLRALSQRLVPPNRSAKPATSKISARSRLPQVPCEFTQTAPRTCPSAAVAQQMLSKRLKYCEPISGSRRLAARTQLSHWFPPRVDGDRANAPGKPEVSAATRCQSSALVVEKVPKPHLNRWTIMSEF